MRGKKAKQLMKQAIENVGNHPIAYARDASIRTTLVINPGSTRAEYKRLKKVS